MGIGSNKNKEDEDHVLEVLEKSVKMLKINYREKKKEKEE